MPKKMSLASTLLAASLALAGCSPKEDGRTVDPKEDGDDDGTDEDPNQGVLLPPPYTAITFSAEDVEAGTPAQGAGFQGKLLRGGDGALYYAYMKYEGLAAVDDLACDQAVFAGGPRPNLVYRLRMGVRAPGGAWQTETVPLQNVGVANNVSAIGARFGLDGVIDASGQPVLAFAAGAGGVGVCASSDLIVATRSAAGTWSFNPAVTASAACCGDCEDPACTSGDTVGQWAAIANRPAGIAVAYSDFHFYWDQDGQTHQGFELWEGGAVSGIQSWSGKGAFASLRYFDDGTPIAAYARYNGGGLFVSRRAAGTWTERDLRPGAEVGERLSLAVAPDGNTLGLAAYVRTTDTGAPADDLVYCRSPDRGLTWAVLDQPGAPPCETVDSLGIVGEHPSLAFDSQGRPAISYYYCGTSSACAGSGDGLRYAWKDTAASAWRRFTVHASASSKAGLYTSLVIDPETDEPHIAFFDLTRGAAMVAHGTLAGGE